MLANWRQGSLLVGTTILWAAPQGEDPVTREHGAEDWDAFTPGPGGGWSIVVSQTCDVGATGPGAKQPFVQVSKILNLDGEPPERVEQIEGWQVTYLAPVPCVPDAGRWAADLRISVPISKGLLIQQSPVAGFPDEAGALRFAEHLAGRMRRPATCDAVIEAISEVLDDVIRTGPKSQDPSWFETLNKSESNLAPIV